MQSLIERILEEDPFSACYPPPVNITGLHPRSTSQFVDWYGVLLTYTNHTSALLQEEELPQEVLNKLNFTLKMMVSILQLFSKVVSIAITTSSTCIL